MIHILSPFIIRTHSYILPYLWGNERINIEQSGGIGYTIQQRRLAIMPWNEDPKEKSPKDLNEEQKEDSFSFLQETIKPEPITGKQVRKQLLKLAVYGIV